MTLLIAILLFILLVSIFFPVKSLRAMMVRRRLLLAEQSERVKRKGMLELCTPYVTSLLTLFNIRISNEKRAEISERLIQAGYEETMSPEHFITFKVLALVGGLLYALLFGLKNPLFFVLLPLIAWLAYKVPTIWLNQRIRHRQEQIR